MLKGTKEGTWNQTGLLNFTPWSSVGLRTQPTKLASFCRNWFQVFFFSLSLLVAANLVTAVPDVSALLSVPPGPPDVDQPCEPSLQAWSPELHLYHMNMTVPCPAEGCSLELLFQHPVHADTLTLWVTYLSVDPSQALFDTEILLEHQESVHLGPLDTLCDTPLTIQLHVDGKVVGVKVYTFDERMEIDAALLTSRPRSPLCAGCSPVRYQVLREPPFASGLPAVVAHSPRKFTDL